MLLEGVWKSEVQKNKSMTEVFRKQDSATIGQLQSLLESAGIQTYLRNEYASCTTIATPEVTPALCILDDSDVERGVLLIRDFLESASVGLDKETTCASCGEPSPGTFATCWKCGESLDSK
jgi:Putative prokaryotic signal transducing protein